MQGYEELVAVFGSLRDGNKFGAFPVWPIYLSHSSIYLSIYLNIEEHRSILIYEPVIVQLLYLKTTKSDILFGCNAHSCVGRVFKWARNGD